MGEGGSQGGKPCLPASFQISDHAAAFWLQGTLLEILSVALESISNLATIQFGSGFFCTSAGRFGTSGSFGYFF